LVIPELYWFILVLWAVWLIIVFKYDKFFFKGTAGMIGIFYGLLLIQDINIWIGLIIIFTGVYLIYEMILPSEREKK